ncbi:protein kinase [Mucilaginibacter sp. PAMB04274]|uniref:serine/threonine protein kinase n=1 Tax=Mucilaginibacter sp. PAMB04274 TaxID=3138568 RepID=UPI0031F6847C
MAQTYFYQLVSYKPLLKQARLNFREDEKCLVVGSIKPHNGWALIISCKTKSTPDLLQKVLPYLKSSECAFRIIKDQTHQYRLNSGTYGEEEIGKAIIVFPDTLELALEIAVELADLSRGYQGPVVPAALRIGEILYVQKVFLGDGVMHLGKPDKKGFPFAIPKIYKKEANRPKILGGCYLPVQEMRTSPKGAVYKAVNLRMMAFNWCLIKEGRPMIFDDHFDRDMKDRLLWQKEVVLQIHDHIKTPGFIDYIERGDKAYLVLDFAEGESLGHHVRSALQGREWRSLDRANQERMVRWFLEAVLLTEQIHNLGMIHRDITDSNFIVLQDDSLCIIDFELSYSRLETKPDPPFLLGTFGYVSPQQLEYQEPDTGDDVYSLGALLAFVLTGVQPHVLLSANLQTLRTKLLRLTGSVVLVDAVIKCLKATRQQRCRIDDIKQAIQHYLTISSKHNDYENHVLAI